LRAPFYRIGFKRESHACSLPKRGGKPFSRRGMRVLSHLILGGRGRKKITQSRRREEFFIGSFFVALAARKSKEEIVLPRLGGKDENESARGKRRQGARLCLEQGEKKKFLPKGHPLATRMKEEAWALEKKASSSLRRCSAWKKGPGDEKRVGFS